MRLASSILLAALLVGSHTGCSGGDPAEGGPADGSAGGEAGENPRADARADSDAPSKPVDDASADAGMDASADAGMDASADAGMDAGADAGTDAGGSAADAGPLGPGIVVSTANLRLIGVCGSAPVSGSFTILNPAKQARVLTVKRTGLAHVEIGGIVIDAAGSAVLIGPGATLTGTASYTPGALSERLALASVGIADEISEHVVAVEQITAGVNLHWTPDSIDFGAIPALVLAQATVSGWDEAIALDGTDVGNCGNQYTQLGIASQSSPNVFTVSPVSPHVPGPCVWSVSFTPSATGPFSANLAWSSGVLGPICGPSTFTVTGAGVPTSCTNGAGAPLPDGTRCAGSDRVCVAGHCVDHLAARVPSPRPAFTPGAATGGTVATLYDGLPLEAATSLSAVIAWGDGSTSPGVVTGASGQFSVTGTHAYAARGPATIGVTVTSTVGTSSRVAYAVAVGGSQVKEVKVPSGHIPTAITKGPDGNLWYLDSNGHVGKMTPAGAFTELTLPPGSSGHEIVAGPDGNLFVTDPFGAQVIKTTPAGAFTVLPVGSGHFPWDIVTGPDGNLWFTEDTMGAVTRMTPAGVVTSFTLPGSARYPDGITVGSDGNLWFAESGSVARITPSGALTELPIPRGNPVKIAAGADGNLWVTAALDGNGGWIDRVSATGVVTELPLPSTAAGLSSVSRIVAGPDGNLWFTEYGAGNVARITTSGVVTEFALDGADRRPEDLTVGPDGDLWFTTDKGLAHITP